MLLNQTTVERFLNVIQASAWCIVAFVMMGWFWIAKLFQVLFGSVFGLLMNACTKRSLRYGVLFNIGILALTVPFAFDMIKDAAGWHHWMLPYMSVAIYLGYVAWGILVQPKPQRR